MTAVMRPSKRQHRSNRSPASESATRASFLNQTAQYALRAMAHLAAADPAQPLTAADMVPATRVPLAYLSKVLRRLVEADLLASQKGHGGGFTLARAAREISFAEILRAVDCLPESDRCAFGRGECDKSHPCALHPVWSRLDGVVRHWAEATTLADVTPVPLQLRRKPRS